MTASTQEPRHTNHCMCYEDMKFIIVNRINPEAVPDLLQALKRIIDTSDTSPWNEKVAMARAALKLAGVL